jgi:hypothetical protein
MLLTMKQFAIGTEAAVRDVATSFHNRKHSAISPSKSRHLYQYKGIRSRKS